MYTREALEIAIPLLNNAGARNAARVLTDILIQQGCKEITQDGVDSLTDLIDVIVYG